MLYIKYRKHLGMVVLNWIDLILQLQIVAT